MQHAACVDVMCVVRVSIEPEGFYACCNINPNVFILNVGQARKGPGR